MDKLYVIIQTIKDEDAKYYNGYLTPLSVYLIHGDRFRNLNSFEDVRNCLVECIIDGKYDVGNSRDETTLNILYEYNELNNMNNYHLNNPVLVDIDTVISNIQNKIQITTRSLQSNRNLQGDLDKLRDTLRTLSIKRTKLRNDQIGYRFIAQNFNKNVGCLICSNKPENNPSVTFFINDDDRDRINLPIADGMRMFNIAMGLCLFNKNFWSRNGPDIKIYPDIKSIGKGRRNRNFYTPRIGRNDLIDLELGMLNLPDDYKDTPW